MLSKISKLKVTVPSLMISHYPGKYVVFCFAAHYISFNALIYQHKAAELKLLGGGAIILNMLSIVYMTPPP